MLGSARGVGLVVTLIRQKFLSIYLEPAGMGVLGLLRRLLDPLKEILPLGVNSGVVKFVSQARAENDEPSVRATVATAAWFFLAISSAATLVILLFSRQFAERSLGSEAYRYLIVLAAVSLPLTVFAGYFNALLVGAQKIATITKIHYVGHAVTLVVSIPLIVLYKLPGAVVGLVLLEGFYCAAYGVVAARYVPINLRSFRGRELTKLSSYGFATLADGGLWMLLFFLICVDFSKRFGKDTFGLYEIISRLSLNYVAISLFVINSFVFPRLAAFREDREAIAEANTAIRGIWLLMVPATLMLSILIRPIIWAFSTPQFYDGAAFLPWQMVGDLFFLTWIILGWALLARGWLRWYVAVALLRNLVFVAAYATTKLWAENHPLNLLPSIVPESLRDFSGWQAIVWSYAAAGTMASLIATIALKRLYGFRLARENKLLISLACVVVLPFLFVPNRNAWLIGLKLLALAAWILAVVRPDEWRKGFRWIANLAARK